MGIEERLVDADVLWTAGRREGALFATLVAITAAAREEYPLLGDGAAFRALLSEHHGWTLQIEHRGQQVSVDQLIWKWLRCEFAHRGALPVDVQFFPTDDAPDDLRIQAGGAPDYCVCLSDGWYWWLRQLIEGWARKTIEATGAAPAPGAP